MAKPPEPRPVRCYLCGHRFAVSSRALSATCVRCHKPVTIEDVVIKSYLAVSDMQTCGRITITKRGRLVARRIQSGEGIECEGIMEGRVESDGAVRVGPKATWKGEMLMGRSLTIAAGAKLMGNVSVPWERSES